MRHSFEQGYLWPRSSQIINDSIFSQKKLLIMELVSFQIIRDIADWGFWPFVIFTTYLLWYFLIFKDYFYQISIEHTNLTIKTWYQQIINLSHQYVGNLSDHIKRWVNMVAIIVIRDNLCEKERQVHLEMERTNTLEFHPSFCHNIICSNIHYFVSLSRFEFSF
jgi:hypothetical protein